MSGTGVEGGRGLRLRVFGFVVHIDLSFVLIMALIGYLSGARTIRDIVIWLIVAALSVLVHELGHAVVARTTGARPEVALTGFGGLTTYVPPRPLSRWRSLAISLAGPLVGLAVGAVLWFGAPVFGLGFASPFALQEYAWYEVALFFGFFTSFWWSVLNLVPVLPLDGGQAMRELLPGDPPTRARRAAGVSVAVLVPLFVLAVYVGQWPLALFLALFGFSNLQRLMAGSQRAAPAGRVRTPEEVVAEQLWQGASWPARQLLESLPPETPVDLAVHGAVLATTDQPEQGFALLHQELARRPGDVNVVALLVLAHILRRDWDAVEADLRGRYATAVPLAVVERALAEADRAGRADVVQRISALPRPGPR